jgi:hypothetical protein
MAIAGSAAMAKDRRKIEGNPTAYIEASAVG